MIICNKCKTENTDGSKFCENCGAPLTAEASVSDVVASSSHPMPPIAAPTSAAPQPQQPEYNTKPVAPPVVPVNAKIKKENPKINATLSIWGYIWTFLVMAIPVVNLVFILIWAFNSNTNKNRKHLAWAVIIIFFICLALELCIYFLVPGVKESCAELYKTSNEWLNLIQNIKNNPEIILYYAAGSN